MIVKDYSTFLDEKDEISLTERVRGTIRYGSSWYTDIQAQELVISHLQEALDDNFILLRNINLPGLEVPIPITLVGPPGVQVIYTSSIKGIFQAKGELWLSMGSGSRRFREAKPNLVNRCLLLTQAVKRHLERFEFPNTPVEAVNMFTDPGIHVDTKNPSTRIVMIDALDRYASSLPKATNMLSVENVQKVVDVLANPPVPEYGPGYSAEGNPELEEAFASPRQQSRSSVTELNLGGRRVRFTNRQWLVLGGLLIINAIIIFFLILIVLFNI